MRPGLALLLLAPCSPYFCPRHHRHLGSHALALVAGEEPAPPPRAGASTYSAPSSPPRPPAPCPSGCLCTAPALGRQVVCHGQFTDHFPVDQLPADTALLTIAPRGGPNRLTLSPSLRLLRRLSALTIAGSGVPNIGRRTLWGLQALQTLNLTRNNISHIVDSNFDGLSDLRRLVLDHNSIKSITSAAFHHLPRLEELSLAHNRLEELAPRIFYKLDGLKRIDLSGNKILVLDEKIFEDIRNIQHFRCDNCGLKVFHVRFSLRFLRELSLAGNAISALEDVEPHVVRGLATLDLSRNLLAVLPALESRRLRHLDLSHNRLSSLAPCAFCGAPVLASVRLDGNRLAGLGEALPAAMPTLTELGLAGNPLERAELGPALGRLPRLASLSLAHTGLVTLSTGLLTGNKELTHLNLSGNHFVDVDPGLLPALPHLQHLDLSHNSLHSLEPAFLASVEAAPTLVLVYLQGNPWACDSCRLAPLAGWLHSSLMYWGACFPPASPSPLCLRCAAPASLAAAPISSLPSLPACSASSLPPDYRQAGGSDALSSLGQYAGAGALLLLLVSALSLALVRYRHYGVYRTGEEEDREQAVLTNPVTVLDRNAESYISLHYPAPGEGRAGPVW